MLNYIPVDSSGQQVGLKAANDGWHLLRPLSNFQLEQQQLQLQRQQQQQQQLAWQPDMSTPIILPEH